MCAVKLESARVPCRCFCRPGLQSSLMFHVFVIAFNLEPVFVCYSMLCIRALCSFCPLCVFEKERERERERERVCVCEALDSFSVLILMGGF